MSNDHRFKRLHDNSPPPDGDHRNSFQRDRDRILYSSSFRRLAEVTQVVAANSGYVFHNRLTHSLQVAQVGRRLAEKLLMTQPKEAKPVIDPDVVEAACLAHDLGHPPFGHIAEHKLNALAKDIGGFEGNAQSFRIVTSLASRSVKYEGLDLTGGTLAAILKYPWMRNENPDKPKKWGAYESEREAFEFATSLLPDKHVPTLEAQMMDWADDVTYSVHDLEDFYRAGRLPLHLLAQRDPQEREHFFSNVFARRKGEKAFSSREHLEDAFTEILISTFSIAGAYDGSSKHRAALRNFTGNLIGRYINAAKITGDTLTIDANLRSEVTMLKELIWTYVIEASSLAGQQYGHTNIIFELFQIYSTAAADPEHWRIFPTFFRERLQKAAGDRVQALRTCVDLIASMTETQAIAMHRRLTGYSAGSGLDDIMN